jgi:hypothetical protein
MMPYLVQILVPAYDNSGQRFPKEHYAKVRTKLTQAFGGLTAFTRAPAEGLWSTGGAVKRDDIIVVEVMTDRLDRSWWREYRIELARLFEQDEMIIRAQTYETV